MAQDLLSILEAIEKEKGIGRETLLEALRSALLSACRKTFPNSEGMDIEIDLNTAAFKVVQDGKEVFHPDFGRIAAQTAKQIIMQKLREAERETIFDDFSKKAGDIVVGNVHRIESRAIIISLPRTEGILPAREQSPVDHFRQGDMVKAYVSEVKRSPRGTEIILSRAHENFVKKLFEMEVPEIHDGIVEIKAVAREAGSRTKIAVISHDEKIDSVGSCVGMRGQRVKNIVREIGGEKIDIIRWNEDMEIFVRNSLSPAELSEVKLSRKEKRAEVFVADDQLSLAIGKKGQNVRLASKLTGWQLDVRALSQKIPLSTLDGVGEKTEKLLRKAGINSVKDILKANIEELQAIEGIGPKTAEKIIASAHKAILGSSPRPQEGKVISGEAALEKKEVSDENSKEQITESAEQTNDQSEES